MLRRAWIGLVAALLAAMGLLGCARSGPEVVVEKLFHHLEHGEIESAVKLIDFGDASVNNAAMKGAKAAAMMAVMSEGIKNKGGIKKIEFTRTEEMDKDNVVVYYKLHFKGGDAEEGKMKCRKVDGTWKIV